MTCNIDDGLHFINILVMIILIRCLVWATSEVLLLAQATSEVLLLAQATSEVCKYHRVFYFSHYY